jgi:PAS domain S-box-containing protein
VVINSRDVTSEFQMEREIRNERELFQNTFESLVDAAFVFTGEPPVILLCNDAAMKIFGYPREKLVGKTTDFLHVNDTAFAEFNQNIHTYIEAGEGISRFVFDMKRADGTVFPAEHSLAPIFDDAGRISSWICLIRDITGEREAEKREAWTLRQIQQNMLQMATINDEIRNPLTVIILISEMVGGEPQEIIMAQVNSINDLVSRLDKGWLYSEKILKYFRKHTGIEDGIVDSDNIVDF